MILSSYPTIDLHGCDRDYAVYLVKDFINDNYKLQKHTIVIIHGIGNGILKNAVHKYLKNNHLVKEFHVDVINTGCTVINKMCYYIKTNTEGIIKDIPKVYK